MAFPFIKTFFRQEPSNIWFVLGPSGAGKTYFCEFLQKHYNWRHINVDEPYPPNGDGLDKMKLRKTWNRFFFKFRGRPLVNKIRRKFASSTRSSIVLSFPSDYVVDANHIRAIKGHVKIVYLYGKQQSCLNAFLERECVSGRFLDEEHWRHHNLHLYQALDGTSLRPWIIEVFQKNGTRKSMAALYDEIEALSDSSPL